MSKKPKPNLITESELKMILEGCDFSLPETEEGFRKFHQMIVSHQVIVSKNFPFEKVGATKRKIHKTSKSMGLLNLHEEDTVMMQQQTLGDEQLMSSLWYVDFECERGIGVFPRREIFESEQEAKLNFRKFRKGRPFDDQIKTPYSEVAKRRAQSLIDSGMWSKYLYDDVLHAESFSTLLILILQGARVIDLVGNISRDVVELVGTERIERLRLLHPDKWRYAIELEYCHLQFPQDSLAYVAAAVRYVEHFSHEFKLAGYLAKDLQMLLMGFEIEHQEDAEKAAANTKISRSENHARKLARWQSLLDGIEANLHQVSTSKVKRGWSAEKLAISVITGFKSSGHGLWKGKVGTASGETILRNIRNGQGGIDLQDQLYIIEKKIRSIINQ